MDCGCKKPPHCVYQPRCGGGDYLTFRRMRVIAIGVFGSNLTIATMNQNLRLLVDGDTASDNLSFCLSGSTLSGAGIAGSFDLPTTGGASNDVLGFTIYNLLVPAGD